MNVIAISKKSFAAFGEDKAQRLASSIAFSSIFSIAPLFIVLIAILGAVVGGHGAAEDRLLAIVQSSAGKSAADTVRQIVAASFNKPRQGVIAQIIGWLTFLLGASNLFASLQDALNSIWHVEKTKGGWKQMLRDRVASGGMLIAVGFLLAITFAANAGVAVVMTRDGGLLPGGSVVAGILSQLLSFVVVGIIFTLIFKVLPDVDILWKDAAAGGFFTALLFVIGQVLIGLYFTKAGVTSAYGAAGSLLVALLWLYYSVIILLLGAEVTKVAAGKAELSANATVSTTEERSSGSDPRKSSDNANA